MAMSSKRKKTPTKGPKAAKSTSIQAIRTALLVRFPPEIVDALFEQYREARDGELIGAHEDVERALGFFAEAAARLCAEACNVPYPAIGDNSFKIDAVINACVASTAPDPYKVLIPRLLRAMYDVRSRRGVDHLSSLRPNAIDARRLMAEADWIIAEIARVELTLDVTQAAALVADLTTPRLPLVEEIHGEWHVLSDDLSPEEQLLSIAFANGGAISKQALLQYASALTVGTKYRAYAAIKGKRLVAEKEGSVQLTATGRAAVLSAAARVSRKAANLHES